MSRLATRGDALVDASATRGDERGASPGHRGAGPPGRRGGAAPSPGHADALASYLRAVQRAIAIQAQRGYARGRRRLHHDDHDDDDDRDDDAPLVLRLRIALDADGQIAAVALAQSSGSPRLDRLAANATQRVHLPPPPPGVPRAARVVTLPIRFEER